jgi:hypothetical protein
MTKEVLRIAGWLQKAKAESVNAVGGKVGTFANGPKPGFLVSQFSAESGFFDWTIRYFTNSDIAHVDLVVPAMVVIGMGGNCAESEMLLGARLKGGVQLRLPNYARFTRTIRVGCQVPDIDAAYHYAFAQIGKPYNKRAIVDMFLHRERLFTPNQKSWFCDELNYEIYLAGGVQLLDNPNPLNLTPQEELLSPLWKPAL